MESPAGKGPNCGYYLRAEHRLIHRHEESLSVNPDNTARWKLRVDFELPNHGEAMIPLAGGDDHLFMFPLVYLRKNESRMLFKVYEEGKGPVSIPTRTECDDISAEAVSQAINFLASEMDPDFQFDEKELRDLVHKIPSDHAFEASMALQFFRRKFGILSRGRQKPAAPRLLHGLGRKVVASGLDETLELLVEHALLWVKLRGEPNERRSITLEQEITLHRRSLVRWSFGGLKNPLNPRPRWNRRWARLAEGKAEKGEVVSIGSELYGRRDRRFSTSGLGERFGQLLAWMPFEFDLPTIYTKRCGSYHFEVHCPPGRTPRDLKVSARPLLAESAEPKPLPVEDARKAFSSRSARFDVPRGGLENVGRFRVIVGIGDGAFPLLWFLAGAVTAAMLWILAGSNPGLSGEHAQTTAGILLIVPALVAAMAASTNEVPISQLIGGARLLLLTTGLSSVIAAAVLAGARPFHLSPSSIWSACAIAATVMTLPLATSWLLSSRFIWHQMRRLKNYERQKAMLWLGLVLAAITIGCLAFLADDTWYRILFAAFLLLLTIGLFALASSRAVMPLGENRRYLGSAFLLAAITCLALGCIELRCMIHEHALNSRSSCLGPDGSLDSPRVRAELTALVLLAISYFIGHPLNALASRGAPRTDEIHLPPRSGKALLTGDSVRELPELFRRLRELGREDPIDQPQPRVTSGAT